MTPLPDPDDWAADPELVEKFWRDDCCQDPPDSDDAA